MTVPTRKVLVSLFLALAVTSVVAAAPSDAANPPARSVASATHKYPVRVFAQNIEGAVDGKHNRLARVRAAVGSFAPQVIALEEICRNQLATFHHYFPSYHYVYTPMRSKAGCRTSTNRNGSIGELLAGRYGLTHRTTYRLPGTIAPDSDPSHRKFHLTCADITLPHASSTALRACVTHTRAGHRSTEVKRNAERKRQIGRIAAITNPWRTKQTVIVAGDFNAQPFDPVLNSMYALSNSGKFTGAGHFVESDQTDHSFFPGGCHQHCRSGQPTVDTAHPKKPSDKKRYDYIFYSKGADYDLHGVALKSDGSDHLPIRSTATLRLA